MDPRRLASKGAKGLFARAIVESGSYNLTQAPLATAEAAGGEFAAKVGCTSNVAACLRKLPVQTIAGAASAIAAQYPLTSYPSPSLALGAVGTDAIFACPALSAEQSLSRYVPTFSYEFSDENAPERFLAPDSFPYGAAHASEIQYLFSTTNTAFPGVLTTDQKRLAALMRRDWTSFASLGSPARSSGLAWPGFEPDTHSTGRSGAGHAGQAGQHARAARGGHWQTGRDSTHLCR